MDASIARTLPFVFPIFFVGLWVFMAVVIGWLTGWPRLQRTYPDRPEAPLLSLRMQSGTMARNVNINGALRLEVCPSGLRVRILRVFGLFSKPFFVPWEEISITTGQRWFWPVSELAFGAPPVGTLALRLTTAARLAAAARGRWPDPTPSEPEPKSAFALRAAIGWLVFIIAITLLISVIRQFLSR